MEIFISLVHGWVPSTLKNAGPQKVLIHCLLDNKVKPGRVCAGPPTLFRHVYVCLLPLECLLPLVQPCAFAIHQITKESLPFASTVLGARHTAVTRAGRDLCPQGADVHFSRQSLHRQTEVSIVGTRKRRAPRQGTWRCCGDGPREWGEVRPV